jgi:hypothetical protein
VIRDGVQNKIVHEKAETLCLSPRFPTRLLVGMLQNGGEFENCDIEGI